MKNGAPGKKALIANAGKTQANAGHSATLLPPCYSPAARPARAQRNYKSNLYITTGSAIGAA